MLNDCSTTNLTNQNRALAILNIHTYIHDAKVKKTKQNNEKSLHEEKATPLDDHQRTRTKERFFGSK